jgi:hypothetical protein
MEMSWAFDQILLNGNQTATSGVYATSMSEVNWGVLGVYDCTHSGVRLAGHDTTGNTQFCTFEQLRIHQPPGGTYALHIDTDSVTANVCHCVFHSIILTGSGPGGTVHWGNSDNNNIGTVFGAFVWDWKANARANYVFHMQANTLTAEADSRNSISWLDQENGELDPVIEGNGILNWGEDTQGLRLEGNVIANAKGSTFGDAAGTAHAAPARTDANVLLYNVNSTNWAGIGADADGNVWIKTGTSGTPSPRLEIYRTGEVVFNPGTDPAADVQMMSDTDVDCFYLDASANAIGIGTNAPAGSKLDVNDDSIRVRTAKTPASAGAAGTQGEIAWDATYFYICVATNTWQRVAHATW